MFSKVLPGIQRFFAFHQTYWWESKKLVYFLMGYGVFFGIVFTFAVPPFFKADEITHFYRTISITQGTFICPQKNGVFLNPFPKDLEDYPLETTIKNHPAYKNREIIPGKPYFYHEKLTACTLPFLPYLPSAFLLAPFTWFNLDPAIIFFAGRLINLFVGLVIMYLALKVIPPKLRLLPTSVFLLPMTWHQMSSFTKDGVHIAFGLLAISFLLSFLQSKGKIERKKMIAFIGSLFMCILARPQFLPLILLVFMIPYQKIDKKSHEGMRLVGKLLLILCISAIVGLSLVFNLYSVDATKLDAVPNYAISDSNLQVQYLLSHPLSVITLPYYTFIHHGQFLVQSMIGTLGNLDIFLDWFVYTCLIILFAQIVLKIQTVIPPLTKVQLSMLTLALVGSIFAILLAMYLYATKVGNFLVDGVQGRYFIVLLPLLLWWLAELRNRFGKKFDIFWLTVIITSILKSTVGWYQ